MDEESPMSNREGRDGGERRKCKVRVLSKVKRLCPAAEESRMCLSLPLQAQFASSHAEEPIVNEICIGR